MRVISAFNACCHAHEAKQIESPFMLQRNMAVMAKFLHSV